LDKILNTAKLNEEKIKSIGQELKLDKNQFNNCLKDEAVKTIVQIRQSALQSAGLSDTPLVFVNNKQINLGEDVKIIDILTTIITE